MSFDLSMTVCPVENGFVLSKFWYNEQHEYRDKKYIFSDLNEVLEGIRKEFNNAES